MTIWISQLLGPIMLIVSIPMIVTPVRLQRTTEEFLNNRPLVLISGVLAMLAGLAIVNTHNLWVWRWPVLITLFGWAMLIGGAIRIAAPQLVDRVGTSMLDQPVTTRVAGLAWGCLGVFLSFKAYI